MALCPIRHRVWMKIQDLRLEYSRVDSSPKSTKILTPGGKEHGAWTPISLWSDLLSTHCIRLLRIYLCRHSERNTIQNCLSSFFSNFCNILLPQGTFAQYLLHIALSPGLAYWIAYLSKLKIWKIYPPAPRLYSHASPTTLITRLLAPILGEDIQYPNIDYDPEIITVIFKTSNKWHSVIIGVRFLQWIYHLFLRGLEENCK